MKNKITLNELFSGIGSQRKALLNIGYDVDVIGISEIDKYAIKSYEAIFGKTRNYGDISKVNKLDYADLWTYSFPCTDISVAGRQEGISHNTRSGLLYQVQRLLDVAKKENTLPKYLLLENVKNLVGKKFKPQFDEWLKYLEQLGYKNYWQVLNAKDYGIPQNRERVFIVSIRNDIDFDYVFPQKEKLKIRLKDVLETNVNNKFYLSKEKQRELLNTINNNGQIIDIQIGTSRGRNPDNPSDRTIGGPTKQRLEINSQGLSNTITTVQKDNYVIEKLICEQRYDEGLRFFKNNICGTLRTIDSCGDKRILENDINNNFKIRKLTPKECWRLMGFNDEDFEKAQASGISNSQLYKQAGNSIVVNVLERIFDNLGV